MMKLTEVQRALRSMVKDLGFDKPVVRAEQNRRWLHVLVAAKEFEDLTQMQRENIIWREFEKRLDDPTLISITQCYLLTPKEFEETFAKIAPQPRRTTSNRQPARKTNKRG